MNTHKRLMKELMHGMPLPARGTRPVLHRGMFLDEDTGACLGVVVLWSYGPVSALLTAGAMETMLYDALSPETQDLVDSGACLMDAARSEATPTRPDGSGSGGA